MLDVKQVVPLHPSIIETVIWEISRDKNRTILVNFFTVCTAAEFKSEVSVSLNATKSI